MKERTMIVPTTITTTSQASLSIALHCIRHSTDAVHGVLLGYYTGGELIITDAVPVTHGAPTLPIVEVALGLLPHCMKSNGASTTGSKNDDANTVQVVGWYTAPMLLNDTKPGPLALRMIANLAQATSSSLVATDPILMVVQNEPLATFINAQTSTSFLKAYTKDSTNQWLKPMDGAAAVTIQDKDDALVAIQRAKDQGIVISDLLDYYDENSTPESVGASSSSTTGTYWYPNDKIVALL